MERINLILDKIPKPYEGDKMYVVYSMLIIILIYYTIWRITGSLLCLSVIPIIYFAFLYVVSHNILFQNMTRQILKFISLPYLVVIAAIDKFDCPVGCMTLRDGTCGCASMFPKK